MAQTLTDRRDVQFVLYEQLEIESITKNKMFTGLNRSTFDMVLTEARSLATKEMIPSSIDADREGCKFENGNVKVPESFHRVFKLLREGEWFAVSDDPEVGGMGMPQVINIAVTEMFNGANTAIAGFIMLGHGAGKLVEVFGTDQQKKLFLDKMYSGEWGGTMALTEPGAGSDVGALTTSAKKNSDGTYSLTGNKIFISAAEHDVVENIINPVLARIEGAPEGVAGISLFLVPKIWVNEDGTLGDRNDIVCTGIEEKIGMHGSPTCALTLGGKGNCRGLLLGKENEGLKTMFHMMNEERIVVAIQSLGLGSAAYLYAVNYARERLQGKHLLKAMDPEAPQVPIIQHPDIRQMLMWMKSMTEGLRSFNLYVSFCIDKVACTDDQEEKKRLEGLISLLTPVCKAYTTERGNEICAMAVQTHGGYGACQDYPVEQLLRDNRISTIYEGTTGIQAMDMLGRKIGMKKGGVFKEFLKEIQGTINKAKKIDELNDLASKLEEVCAELGKTALNIGQAAASPKVMAAFAHATHFLEVFGDVSLGWMWLWRAVIASPKLAKLLGDGDDKQKKEILKKNKEASFYYGQIQTARYFINTILPVTIGKMNSITGLEAAPVEMTDGAFGG